jgi:DNA-binding NarL/FixJ family response regulator
MIRILVADAYPLFRQGIRAVLGEVDDIEIVAEADKREDVIGYATTLNPDVVLCNSSVPGLNGLEVTRSLRLFQPNTGVVLMSTEEDEEFLFEAVKAGASAHVLRHAAPDELVETIRRVARGEHLIDENLMTRPALATKVLRQFSVLDGGGSATPGGSPIFAPLSPREIEILELISRGNSNKQIARILAISDQTVKNHITSILKKLAVNDRTEAVVFSLRQGWIKIDAVS